jgi:hypothetical protein
MRNQQYQGALSAISKRSASIDCAVKEDDMAKTVEDQFAEILAAAGVRRIYGVVGDNLHRLRVSLRRQGKV